MIKRDHLFVNAVRPVERAAKYLVINTQLLHYDRALAERDRRDRGAYRYLVKGSDGRIGAPWSSEGAEAVLHLRALRASGDFTGTGGTNGGTWNAGNRSGGITGRTRGTSDHGGAYVVDGFVIELHYDSGQVERHSFAIASGGEWVNSTER